MTISIDRGTLLAALKKCLPGVDKGTALFEGADTFMFTPGFVHAYNDAIAVSAPLTRDGRATNDQVVCAECLAIGRCFTATKWLSQLQVDGDDEPRRSRRGRR